MMRRNEDKWEAAMEAQDRDREQVITEEMTLYSEYSSQELKKYMAGYKKSIATAMSVS